MALRKSARARLANTNAGLSVAARRMRRNFARLLLAKLDAQIRRGRIINSPRKDSHGLSAGS
jgi:hypothetical protein